MPGRLERLVWWLRPDGERPPGVTLLRADALGDVVAAPTIVARALPLDDRLPAVIHGGCPADPRLARRTAGLGRVPIELARLGVTAGALAGVPVIVEARGAQQVHALVVPTVHEQVGVQDAGVHHMRAG